MSFTQISSSESVNTKSKIDRIYTESHSSDRQAASSSSISSTIADPEEVIDQIVSAGEEAKCISSSTGKSKRRVQRALKSIHALVLELAKASDPLVSASTFAAIRREYRELEQGAVMLSEEWKQGLMMLEIAVLAEHFVTACKDSVHGPKILRSIEMLGGPFDGSDVNTMFELLTSCGFDFKL